jgi:simple sugar transport system permease protein
MNRSFPMLHSTVTIMTPLLWAAAGGLFTELSGMLNIALEGLLLTGAFAAFAAVCYTGSLLAGAAAGAAASLALALLLAFTTLKLRSNVFITGLAANLFAAGTTVVLSQHLFGTRGVVTLRDGPGLTPVVIPLVKDIPVLGDLFSGHSLYLYSGLVFLFICRIALYHTPFGFRLRACDKYSASLVSLGIRPEAYRFGAFLISGFCCGIGGSFLSLNLGAFVPGMSAGKGWTALVMIFLGGRRPRGLLAAALVFGLAEAFSNYAQGLLDMPADFILALPHGFTLLVMIGVSVYEKRRGGLA